MVREFLTLSPAAFGLDISDYSLKLAELKRSGKELALTSFGETPIAPGVIQEGEVAQEEKLVDAIQEAISNVRGKGLSSKYVIASLPEEKAFLQVIQFPQLQPEELGAAIRFEAENYIPFPLDSVYLDYQIIPPVQNHLDHMDVMIVSVPRKTVNSYITAIEEAGLVLKAMEIESMAIARTLVEDQVSSVPLLLVDIGRTRTSFSIYSGHSLRFATFTPLSGQSFTESVVRSLGVDEQEGEKLKRKYGVRKDQGAEGDKTFDALIPAVIDLTEQIKKYIGYYQSHSGHQHLAEKNMNIKKIFLCGGGANLPGLAELLTRELKIETRLGNPWANISPEFSRELPPLSFQESLRYTTVLGLALRGASQEHNTHD